MKRSKIWIIIGIVGILLLLLTFASPLLIMYYAEEQYFIDQYKKNETAFENIKNELLLILEKENVTELNLVVSYDSEKGRILRYYDRTTYSIDKDNFIDANSENYNTVNESFGEFSFSKIYMLHITMSVFPKKATITSIFIHLNAHLKPHIMPQEMTTKSTNLVIPQNSD